MFISIVTSVIFFMALWLGMSTIINIDTAVNMYCILLMHKTNEIYYNKICSVCHNKTYKCCNNYIDKQRNKTKKIADPTIQV